MHEYQGVMSDFVLDNPKCALFCDMGLGKTISALTAIVDLFNQFEIRRVLIIAPLRVANTVWDQETEEWVHTQGLDSIICTGTESERFAALDSDAEIYIINRENVAWMVKNYRGKPGIRKSAIRQWKWDMLVLDESTSFKTPSSLRHRAIKSKLGFIDRIVELTGSPAANGLKDLYGQIYLLDRGERLGRTFGDFKNRYFEYNEYTREYTILPWAEEVIYKKISDICLVMEASDHLDLPDTIENTIYVDLSPKHMKMYKKLEDEFYLKLSQVDEEVIALTGAALSTKLMQFCNGAIYTEEGKTRSGDKWAAVHNEKIDAMKSIIEEANGHPVLVAYNFKSDLARLKKEFPKGVQLDKKKETENKWNRGEIPILFVHPASGGHGLNLQKGGYITAWFGQNWSLEYYEQLNARLGPVRQKQSGTGKVPIVHNIVVRGGMDEQVLQRVKSKESVQSMLKRALKDHQQT